MENNNTSPLANAAILGQKLRTLQSTASVVSRSIITTNKVFYEHLADLYMWWREAEKVPKYLDAEYGGAAQNLDWLSDDPKACPIFDGAK